jgi:hypothetical protein
MLHLWVTLALVSRAHAYTVEDLATAAQYGMSADALYAIARDVGPITSEDAVLLLRSGVPESLLADLTNGAHPTDEEIATARAAGHLEYTRRLSAPVDYTGLSDGAWLRLVGKEIVVTTRKGPVTGVLKGLATNDDTSVLLMEVAGEMTDINLFQVQAVRRIDGAPIAGVTEQAYEENAPEAREENALDTHKADGRAHDKRALHRTGNGLVAGGVGALVLGVISMVAYSNELNAALEAGSDLDLQGAVAHSNAASFWGGAGYVSLVASGPMIVGGLVCIRISGKQR